MRAGWAVGRGLTSRRRPSRLGTSARLLSLRPSYGCSHSTSAPPGPDVKASTGLQPPRVLNVKVMLFACSEVACSSSSDESLHEDNHAAIVAWPESMSPEMQGGEQCPYL